MKIIKIKPENKSGIIKGVDQYRVVYQDEPGKEKVQRRFAIKRLKYISDK
ncbi:MAG: hypothetical protein Q7J15_09145 [Candidatus Desulfaltia sp.]|nr:hypothetical protein [Candidatus Desulfaltia sp.]